MRLPYGEWLRDEARALPPAAAAVTALEQVVDQHAGHRRQPR
jgi:hypothetical protein